MTDPTLPAPPARAPLRALDEALAELLEQAVPLAGSQTVATFDADGRVLAQDLIASLDVPGHDNSSMDGYAVRVADCASGVATLKVSQRISAGQVPEALHSGTASHWLKYPDFVHLYFRSSLHFYRNTY